MYKNLDLVLRGVTNQTLGLAERHHGRCDTGALLVGDDVDLAILEDGDTRVRRSEIDTDDGSHFLLWSLAFRLLGEGEDAQQEEKHLK